MPKAIIIKKFGSVNNLKIYDFELKPLKKNEIKIKQTAIGVNFLDIYHRKGNHFNNISLPGIIGVEGVGIIEKKHSSVEDFEVGDKIAYPLNIGAYTTHRNIEINSCYKLPDAIDDNLVAASFMKGLTVSHILFDVININKGDVILWHAIAGGVGLIACQWAKKLGAIIIGTVGSDNKIDLVKKYGCDYVINYNKELPSKKIIEITNGELCDAVIDGVGKFTWLDSLKSVKPYGKCISFGLASGPLPVFSFEQLPAESYITRATVGSVVANRNIFLDNSIKYINAINKNFITPRIDSLIPLKDAMHAHNILENRQNIGSLILKP